MMLNDISFKSLEKVRKMGEKFDSLFGEHSKLYDQRTYAPFHLGGWTDLNRYGFTSEEGRDIINPCPFGFNRNLMIPRQFQRSVLSLFNA